MSNRHVICSDGKPWFLRAKHPHIAQIGQSLISKKDISTSQLATPWLNSTRQPSTMGLKISLSLRRKLRTRAPTPRLPPVRSSQVMPLAKSTASSATEKKTQENSRKKPAKNVESPKRAADLTFTPAKTEEQLAEQMKFLQRTLAMSIVQVRLMDDRLEDLERRYHRAAQHRLTQFAKSLRMQHHILAGFRDVFAQVAVDRYQALLLAVPPPPLPVPTSASGPTDNIPEPVPASA